MFLPFVNFAMLAAECQQVVGLRLMKLAFGGKDAVDEAQLMMSEKMLAAHHAMGRMMMGDTHDSIVTTYREVVQANVVRLSKP